MNNRIMTAEILSVGTELLLGEIINTDAAYLARKLADLGISVFRHGVVGDNAGRIKAAFAESLSRADLLVTSGGLGPTSDDMTKECASELFGRDMHLDTPSLDNIRTYFKARGMVMTDNNIKQALMPEGAIIFKNDYGTAPALAIEGTLTPGGPIKTIVMLPGPPRELVPVFENEVLPYLSRRTDCVMVSRNINIYGIGESAVEEMLREIMLESENPTVAPYCKDGEVRLRVTARAGGESEARKMCGDIIALIRKTPVSDFIYDIDSSSLEDSAVRLLRSLGLTLSTAESCTGGLVAKRFTDIAGVSDVFMGGCITYSNQSKTELLGVSPETLAAHGAVSAQTALEMARGVRLRLGTDVGISTTGIAGPGGGTPEKPVGTVYIAISTKAEDNFTLLTLSSMRERAYIRTLSANEAIAQILKLKHNR